jgi:electron transport complex protein RnfG
MSAALGFVYLKTKGPIEATAKQTEIDAIKQVMPAFDSDPLAHKTEIDGVIIYRLHKDEQLVGYAIKSYTDKGFAGHIDIMAGFLPDGTIHNIVVLNHKETPGLGTKMTDPSFSGQFSGKNPAVFNMKVKKDGGEVDAITAATVSSRAYTDALQRAYENMIALKEPSSVKQ